MDEAHNDTDRALIALERRIRAVYREAEADTKRKLAEFTRKFKAKDAIYRAKLKKGEITEAQYRAWLAGQVFQGKQWRAKVEQMADGLVRADQMAQGIINEKVNDVFATNANWQSYHFEHEAGVDLSFGIYDASTVARLLRDQPMLFPKKQVDIPKDKLWNQKLITRQITQGILQGEGLMDVAKRLQRVTDMDRSAAIRNARTGLTGAQNAGRQESMQRAVKMGIKTRKKWLATLDGHTRISHAYLDGKSVDVGEAFVYQGHKIRYPGDPQAVPAMVYNCRCTLIDDLVDYPDKSERRDNINGQLIKDMSYTEWLEAKKDARIVPQYVDKIRRSKLFSGLSEDTARIIFDSIVTDDEYVLRTIFDTCDRCAVKWEIGTEGTSNYEFSGARITMHKKGENREELARTFWHEYGHFIDDERTSKSGLIYVEKRDGYENTWHGATAIARRKGYYQASCKDVNNFLRRNDLSSKYEMIYDADEMKLPQIVRITDKKPIDFYSDTDDIEILSEAFDAEFRKASGENRLLTFWRDKGQPDEVKYEDYYTSYLTPKRKQWKTKPKYKGAEEDYIKAMQKREAEYDKFASTHDIPKLQKEYDALAENVERNKKALGFVSDTFDGAAHGMFSSAIYWGGHTYDYYHRPGRDMGIAEGVANVFSQMVTGNELQEETFKHVCPNIYAVIKEALTVGK